MSYLFKKIVFVLLASVLSFSFFVTRVDAVTFSDPYAKKKYYDDLAKKAEAEKNRKQQQAADLEDQIEYVDGQIADAEAQIEFLTTESSKVSEQIQAIAKDIIDKEDELEKQKHDLNSLVSSWYMEGNGDLLSTIISANSISEVMDSQQYYDSVQRQMEDKITSIEQVKRELLESKNDRESKLADLGNMKVEQDGQKNYLEGKKSVKNQLITDTNAAIDTLKKERESALKLAEQAQGEIRDMENRAASQGTRLLTGSKATGFNWPLSSFRRGCPFGYSACYFADSFHTGIDLNAYEGAAVYAAKDGEVVAAVDGFGNTYPNSKIYGNYIKIRHEGGVITLYGHMKKYSLTVKVGDHVSRGQQIGKMGNTGFSTGSHLHFEMRDFDGAFVNPETYLP